MFLSWVRHHGRSVALANALDVPAVFVGVGTLGNRRTAPWRHAVQTLRTLWLLTSRRPPALYVMAPPLPLVVLGLGYQRLTGRPVVIDAHSGAVVDARGELRRSFLWAARRARATIVTTEALRRLALRRDAGLHLVALHDAPFGPPAPAAAWPPASPVVVMPSSWWWDEPLAALREAAARTPDIELVLTGRPRGPHAEAEWPPNVRLAGWLDDPSYAELLASATAILALTTRELTMQRAGYEAVVAGRPAIVSDTGVLREYFTKGAVFAAPTAASLADALVTAVTDARRLAEEMTELRTEKQAEFAEGVRALQSRVGVGAPAARR